MSAVKISERKRKTLNVLNKVNFVILKLFQCRFYKLELPWWTLNECCRHKWTGVRLDRTKVGVNCPMDPVEEEVSSTDITIIKTRVPQRPSVIHIQARYVQNHIPYFWSTFCKWQSTSEIWYLYQKQLFFNFKYFCLANDLFKILLHRVSLLNSKAKNTILYR